MFHLESARGRTAWIILILALLFALPTSAALAARTSTHVAESTAPPWSTFDDPQIPNWEEPLHNNFKDEDNVPVTYDPVKGAVEQEKIPDPKPSPSEETGNNKGPSGWPDSTTVKVIAAWPSADKTECSGVLVAEKTILTAGHCVFTHNAEFCEGEGSCWAADLQIFTLDEQESGYTKILTWTAWTQNRDYEYDLAGVRLKQAFGNEVGWLGFGYNMNNQIFSNSKWEYTSFPVNAEDPPKTSGPFSFTGIDDENHLLYSVGSSEYGQSGAGAYSSEHDHIVYSVLSHHNFEGDIKTGHTRITPLKFFALRDWIKGFMDGPVFKIYLPLFTD